MTRFFALGTLLLLLTAPAVSPAADKTVKTDGPTLMVRLQSINSLLDNAEYIAGLAGQEETAKQVLGFVKALSSGDKGIEGVDTKRPFVLYANIVEEVSESEGVVMIPIADKDSFLALLKGDKLKLAVTDEKDGLYSVKVDQAPAPIYFRFANDYVYGTFKNRENVDVKKLPKPEEVVGKSDSVLSIGFRVDRMPEEVKKFALGALETALAQAKDQPLPNETDSLKAVKVKAIDSLAGGIKSILFEGKEITFHLDLQPKKDEIAIEFEISAKEGSHLAKDFADLKSKKSIAFGSLVSSKSAIAMAWNLSVPASVKKVIGPAIDEAVKNALGMAPGEVQEAIEPLVKAIMPTLKAGDLDGGFMMAGPDAKNLYTLVIAAKLAEGKEVEKAIKELVKKIPEPVGSAFELESATAGEYKLHKMSLSNVPVDEKAKKLFGESDLWFAFRDDAVLFAFGPNGKEALTEAIGKKAATGPVAKLELAVTRLLPLAEAQDAKSAQEVAKKVFGKEVTGDTLAFSVEGGDSLHIRVAVKGKVIRYAVLSDQAKKKGN